MFRNIKMGLSLEDETLTPEIDQALLDVSKLTSNAPEDKVEKTSNEQEKQDKADTKTKETDVEEDNKTNTEETKTEEESDSNDTEESLPTLAAVAEELYKETTMYTDIVLESLVDTSYLCSVAKGLENCKATNSLDNTTIKLTNSIISSVATRAGYPLASKDKLSLESINTISGRSTYVQESLSRIGNMISNFFKMIINLLKKAWSMFKEFLSFNSFRLDKIKKNLVKLDSAFEKIRKNPHASGSYDKNYLYYLVVGNLSPMESLKNVISSTLTGFSTHLAENGRYAVKDLNEKSKLKDILLGNVTISARIEQNILPMNILTTPNRGDIKELNIPSEVSNLVSTYSCSLSGNTILTAVVAQNNLTDEEYTKVVESNVLKLGIFKREVTEQPTLIRLLEYVEIKPLINEVFNFHNKLVLLSKQEQTFEKFGDNLIKNIYVMLQENNNFDITDASDIEKVNLNIALYRSIVTTLVKFYQKGMMDLGKYSLTVLDAFTDYISESIKIHVKPDTN